MRRLLSSVVLLWVLAACVSPPDPEHEQPLYLGSEVEIDQALRLRERRALASEIEGVLSPVENRALLGVWRPWLGLYYLTGGTEAEGVRGRLQERFAEQPVYFSPGIPEANSARILYASSARGYFDAELSVERYTPQEAHVGLRYRLRPGLRYRIGQLSYAPTGVEIFDEAVERALLDTSLEHGGWYHIDALRAERSRIDSELKNHGFFSLNSEHLVFEGERNRESHTVDLELQLRDDAPPAATRQYRVENIFLFLEYAADADPNPGDREQLEQAAPGIYIVQPAERYRSSIVIDALVIEPGELYSRRKHLRSLSRLSDLNIFQFSSLRYRESEQEGHLDAFLYLTPSPSRVAQVELQALSRSNDFAGPALAAGYRDLNAFRGAEELSVEASAALETGLWEDAGRTVGSYEYGVEVGLSLPRVVAPFALDRARTGSLPRTRAGAGVQSLTRVDTYRLESANARFGYAWRSSPRLSHEFDLLDLTLVRPDEFSPGFQEQLDENPLLARSFEQQFLAGARYNVVWNTRAETEGRRHSYARLGLESSGAVLNLVGSLSDNAASTENGEPARYLDTPYAQFIRFDADLRQFIPTLGSRRIAARLMAGAGVPYGNSDTLPRIRRFAVGGTNSMRAFAARSIGPGSIPPGQGTFDDRAGDIRIEANLEYRFELTRFLRGALFVDMGNIWDLPGNEEREEGAFVPEQFLSDLAAGGGFGLRFDPGFAVLRLDVATPLRKPWVQRNDGWVIEDMQPLSLSWLRENLVFNLAIGYPF